MSKLVDKERLAKLAQALDARMKAAVKAEEERAMAAEQAVDAKAVANAAAIAAINNAETGLLKQAKDYADEKVEAEKGLRETAEGLLDGRIQKLEGIVGDDAEGAFGQVKQQVADNKADIATLKGEGEGSVKKAVADAVQAEEDRAKEVEEDHEARIAANEAFVGAQPDIDKAQNQRLSVIEEMMGLGGAEGDKTALQELTEAVNSKVDKEAYDAKMEALDGKDDEFEGRIKAVEDFKAAHDDSARDARIQALEDANKEGGAVANAIKAAQDAADAAQADVDAVEQRLDAEGGLVDRIEANEVNIARLDGAVDVEGSVKKQIKDAIDAVNGAAQALEGRVATNEAFVAGYAAKEQKVREDFAAADATNLQAAKDYADQKITALVDSAPEAMNTLNELAEAIKGNKDVYDAYVEQHAEAMAAMKKELQDEIDADVKKAVDDQKLVNDDQAETNANFEGRIAANEAFKAAQPGVDAAQDAKIKALEDAIGEGGATKQAIEAAQKAAEDAQEDATQALADAAKAQGEVDAVELRVDALEAFKNGHSHADMEKDIDDAQADIEELQAFMNAHSHEAMEKGIQDNAKAIEDEVKEGGARDQAIAKALEAYADEEEVKAMLGNVINSLGIAIVDNKLQLTLGTNDFVIKEVELDMATDDDIAAIIAGLDAPAAE